MVFSRDKIRVLEDNGKGLDAELSVRYVLDLVSSRTIERSSYGLAPTIADVRRAFPDTRSITNRTHSMYNKPYLVFTPEEKDQIGISSLDLRVGKIIAESDSIMQGVTIKDMLKMKHYVLDENEQFTFDYDSEGGKVYYVSSFESIAHSPDIELHVDSKSTTGRLGIMTHGAGIAEEGKLITIVQPFSFPLKVIVGKTKLYQMAIRFKDTAYMSNEEILNGREVRVLRNKNLKKSLNSRGLLLRFNSSFAYRAKKCETPIDMDNPKNNNWKDYFEIVEGNSKLKLDKKTLYLLGSLEEICLGAVSGFLSREEEVITGTGAWGHFAGIIQPYFVGGITLEFYSFNNRVIKRGDNAGVVRFDKLVGEIDDPEEHKGYYHKQKAPTLPKVLKKAS